MAGFTEKEGTAGNVGKG